MRAKKPPSQRLQHIERMKAAARYPAAVCIPDRDRVPPTARHMHTDEWYRGIVPVVAQPRRPERQLVGRDLPQPVPASFPPPERVEQGIPVDWPTRQPVKVARSG